MSIWNLAIQDTRTLDQQCYWFVKGKMAIATTRSAAMAQIVNRAQRTTDTCRAGKPGQARSRDTKNTTNYNHYFLYRANLCGPLCPEFDQI